MFFSLLKLLLPDVRYLIATNKAIEPTTEISNVTPKCKNNKDVIGWNISFTVIHSWKYTEVFGCIWKSEVWCKPKWLVVYHTLFSSFAVRLYKSHKRRLTPGLVRFAVGIHVGLSKFKHFAGLSLRKDSNTTLDSSK